MVNTENTKTVGTVKEKPEITKSNSKKFLDVHSLKGFEDEETLRNCNNLLLMSLELRILI